MQILVSKHPLVQHKLTMLRDYNTDSNLFRKLLAEISLLLAYEALQNHATVPSTVKTHLGFTWEFPKIEQHKIILLPILRSGLGMLNGVLDLLPAARVGYHGLERDHTNLTVSEYYFKIPNVDSSTEVLILDPVIATGHTAAASIARVQQYRPKSVILISVLATPKGLMHLEQNCCDNNLLLHLAGIDRSLNDRAYIVPGLGDVGDRLFGTVED